MVTQHPLKMTDNELWKLAIADLRRELNSLDREKVALIRDAAAEITGAKEAIFTLTAQADGGSVCAGCGGECCTTGKYHVTVIDILVLLLNGAPMLDPCFGKGRCPYLGDNGCMMAPAYRPYNCITFHCERIEGLCEPFLATELLAGEERLKVSYRRLEELFGRRLWEGALHFAEREFVSQPLEMRIKISV